MWPSLAWLFIQTSRWCLPARSTAVTGINFRRRIYRPGPSDGRIPTVFSGWPRIIFYPPLRAKVCLLNIGDVCWASDKTCLWPGVPATNDPTDDCIFPRRWAPPVSRRCVYCPTTFFAGRRCSPSTAVRLPVFWVPLWPDYWWTVLRLWSVSKDGKAVRRQHNSTQVLKKNRTKDLLFVVTFFFFFRSWDKVRKRKPPPPFSSTTRKK